MKMACEVTEIFHGAEAARQAQENFIRIFSEGNLPDEKDIPVFTLRDGQSVLDVLVEGNLVSSKSEGRRLIDQKGVRLDGETLNDPNKGFPHPGVLQAGKRKFLKIVSQN